MGVPDPGGLARARRGASGRELRGDGISVEHFLRVEGATILASLVRYAGDFDLAEDALQDATLVALERWSHGELPDNAAAWLTTAARNKLLDRLRREGRRTAKETEAVRLLAEPRPSLADQRADKLRLIFTCCHPALAPEARVALSLRALCRLTTAEIASAFLVPEKTMGQRISRAKRKIRDARIPYRIPDDHELPDRLDAVLAVLYLVFTTGHHPPSGELGSRVDLAEEAIRLAREVHELMPDEAEATGLLALLLTTHARRAARLDAAGDQVLLADQDRALWDRSAIDEASALTERALRCPRRGPYAVQAAIASLHSEATTFADTDWPQIADLYGALEELHPTPVVRVNRAVAVGEADGPGAALDLLDTIEDPPEAWHLYWTTRADLLRRLGRTPDARDAYERALGCGPNDADRRFIEGRLTELT